MHHLKVQRSEQLLHIMCLQKLKAMIAHPQNIISIAEQRFRQMRMLRLNFAR